MRRIFGLAVALCLVTGAANGSETPSGAEQLLMPLPDGFKVDYTLDEQRMRMAEFVPKAESVHAWSQMATRQVFLGRGGADPDFVQQQVAAGWKAACPGAVAQRLEALPLNGYKATLWSFACPLNPATGKPETTWIKVISGADSLYAAHYAFRDKAAPERSRTALDYLARVTVCDMRTVEHPCPAGVADALAKP